MAAIVESSPVKELESKVVVNSGVEDEVRMDESASSEEAEEKSTESVSADEDSASADDKKIENDDEDKAKKGGGGGGGESSDTEPEEVTKKMTKKVEKDSKDEEVKTPKKRGRAPKKPTPTPSAANGHHGTGRERKQVERFSVPTVTPSKKGYEQAVDAPGKGDKFGDIPFIAEMINKTKASDPAIGNLYHVCFGKRGKQALMKRQLRVFSGFPFEADADEFKKRKTSVGRWSLTVCKKVFKVLGLQYERSKEEFEDKLLEFCLKPFENKTLPKSKARRSSSSKKKTSSKSKSSKKSSPKEKGKAKKRKHDSDAEDNEEEDAQEKSESEEGGSDVDDEPEAKRSKKDSPKKVVKKVEVKDDSEEDESEDDSEPEVNSSEDEKKKKKKTSGRKKSAAQPKSKKAKKPAKKASKKEKSESEESEDEPLEEKSEESAEGEKSEEDDEDYDIATISNEDLKKVLKRIIKKSDLDALSMKMVLQQIKQKFKIQDLEPEKKALIRTYVDELLGSSKG